MTVCVISPLCCIGNIGVMCLSDKSVMLLFEKCTELQNTFVLKNARIKIICDMLPIITESHYDSSFSLKKFIVLTLWET